MENRDIFSDKAEVYARYRPTYPHEVVTRLESFITPKSNVCDIGAGTGLFTKCLCWLGCDIVAVEPNMQMLKQAMITLQNYEKVTYVNSPAEDTMLAENSCDLITCAQSFHWFDKKKFKAECKRILKPYGKVLLLWNTTVDTHHLVAEINDIHRSFFNGFDERNGAHTPARRGQKEIENFFDEFEIFKIENNLQFDLDGFIGNYLSRSYAPTKDDKCYDDYIEAHKEYFERHQKDGIVSVPNVTECYLGRI